LTSISEQEAKELPKVESAYTDELNKINEKESKAFANNLTLIPEGISFFLTHIN
jgi:hypothetical protein